MFALVVTSCDLVNPAEPVPAYIKLRSPIVVTASGQDTVSENIVNTWVYSGSEALGVFNRTATIPVLGEGEKKIICLAGVYQNGVSAVRVIYPFYSSDSVTATISPNADIVVNPVYKYLDSTQFAFDDNFDQPGSLFGPRSTSTSFLEFEDGANVFQGAGSGRVVLTDSASLFEYFTIDEYPLSSANRSIYLELDYKTDATIEVGLYQVGSNEYLYGWNISPKDQWNKIYLNLMDAVTASGGGAYKVLIKANKPSDMDTAFVYLDNVKLLHF